MRKVTLAVLAVAALAAATIVRSPPEWAVQHQPAATTAATISKAAAAGIRHVATGAVVCVTAVAAQPALLFNLRDGASGAGTILWAVRLSAAAGTSQCVRSPPLNLVGTANTAMTLESAAAPASTNFATVALSGYDVASDGTVQPQ